MEGWILGGDLKPFCNVNSSSEARVYNPSFELLGHFNFLSLLVDCDFWGLQSSQDEKSPGGRQFKAECLF